MRKKTGSVKSILEPCPEHLPELTIAVGTGMRKSGSRMRTCLEAGRLQQARTPLAENREWRSRDVPMSAAVSAAFQQIKRASTRPTHHVFAMPNPRVWFEAAREKAKLEDFRWHDCRHTFCSRLAMAGVPLKTIQMLAGHKTISITARYAHLAPNTLHAAVDLIRVPGYKPEQSIPKSITSTPRKIFTGRKSLAVSASK